MGLILNHDQTPSPARLAIAGSMTWLTTRYRVWKRQRRDKRAVSHLSEQTLRDIGLEEHAAVRRNSVFWLKLQRMTPTRSH